MVQGQTYTSVGERGYEALLEKLKAKQKEKKINCRITFTF